MRYLKMTFCFRSDDVYEEDPFNILYLLISRLKPLYLFICFQVIYQTQNFMTHQNQHLPNYKTFIDHIGHTMYS